MAYGCGLRPWPAAAACGCGLRLRPALAPGGRSWLPDDRRLVSGREPGLRRHRQCPAVNGLVALGHDLDREARLDVLAAERGLELARERDADGKVIWVVNDDAGLAVHDQLWHGAAAKRDDRRAAGHRLDDDQAERLLPADREHHARRAGEQAALVGRIGDTVYRHVAADSRLDLTREVRALDRLGALAGQDDRHPGSPGRVNSEMRGFIRVESAEEERVIILLCAERERLRADGIVHGGRPGHVWRARSLRIGDGDELDGVAECAVVLPRIA